jgi:HlyD family secretion protein
VAASRKSKKFWIWLIAGIVVVVALLGFGWARMVSGSSLDPNKLAKVTRGDVARSVVATGKIQPITKVEVKSKASGIVEKLFVDINNQVHKGQQLAQLDQQEIVAQVDAQRAQLGAAEANVATYEANIEQDKVNAAAPDLPMYKATLDRNLEMKKHREPPGAGRRQQGLPGRAHPARQLQGADRRGCGPPETGAGAGAAGASRPQAA